MIINIAYTDVNYELLTEKLAEVDELSDVMPYAIMSQKTMDALPLVFKTENGGYEFRGYRILINNDLRFGDVDIR